MIDNAFGLIGDIGATHARFALADDRGGQTQLWTFATDKYPSIFQAVSAYLSVADISKPPKKAVLAIAAAVTGDQVKMTNHQWEFSIEGLRAQLGFERLSIINDFAANALAIGDLAEEDLQQIGGSRPASNAPIGVIGPGSGLGMSALLFAGDRPIPIPSEGGHATMAASDPQESAVLDLIRQWYGHASAERVLSGPGLVNLYKAICRLSDTAPADWAPTEITDPAIGSKDRCAREATGMFCDMLGTVAGNLALTLDARGGIYIAGGIVPQLGSIFLHSGFRRRFESKGRFHGYLEPIPAYVITKPIPAFLGAARLLAEL